MGGNEINLFWETKEESDYWGPVKGFTSWTRNKSIEKSTLILFQINYQKENGWVGV